MSKQVTYEINLLPKDPFFETNLGRFLNWAVNVGRYIVIFTELIVIVSFAGRFVLDRRMTNLNEALHQKQLIIESQQQFESEFRLAQAKVNNYQQIEQQDNLVDIFPDLQKIVPKDLVMNRLTIQDGEFSTEATAISNDALNYFISNLQLSPSFREINVSRIETQEDDQVGFNVMVSAKFMTQEEDE